jgi:hypothetical protein
LVAFFGCQQNDATTEETAPGTSEKIFLQLRFEEGKTYRMRMTTQQKITQTMQGRTMEMPQSIGFGLTQAVKEVKEDGTAVVQVTYDSIQFKQEGPMGAMDYDSDNPPETVPLMAKGFAALVGQGFSLDMTPEGRVIRVEGADQLLARVTESIDIAVPAMRSTIETQMKQQFGDQALKEMMEQMMAIYPEEAVAVGDSWSRKMTVARGFPMIIDNNWTLKSRADGVAVVEVSSKVEPNPDAGPMEMGGMSIQQKLRGTQNGTIEIDETSGWVVKSTLNQDFSGEMTVVGGPQEVTIPMSLEGAVLVETLDAP